MTSLGPITERRFVAALTLVATLLLLHGSSVFVASIIGVAVGAAIMGFISDHSNIRVAFVVPLICEAYGLSFALRGRQPVLAARHLVPELSTTA
jgi:fucose permease